MNIKQPPAYDISHWEEVPDFALLSPRPSLIITKATEGTTFVDDKFIRYMDGMQAAGIRRGCYHFHRKAYSPVDQAVHFTQWCKAVGITKRDILVLDVEEGGETAGQLQGWFDVVRTTFPENLLMLYSRKNLLDPISMTTSQKNFFRQIPIWTAGYPANPDIYASPPASYIPDQSKWGPVWMWQYSDKGSVSGITGEVDLNWLSPELLTWLDVPRPSDMVDFPYIGVMRTKGIRHGCNVQVLEIQQDAIQSVKLFYSGQCETVESIPGDIVANMTGFTLPGCVPNQLLKIDNKVIHEQAGTEPYFYWDSSHKLHFDHHANWLFLLSNTSSIKRYVVVNGVKNQNPSDAWNEVHPWQLLGAGQDGRTISLMVQAPGFTLHEAAELMLEFGVYVGGDLDSGGSGQTRVKGEVTRCTSEVRAVSNFFSLNIGQQTGGTMNFKVKDGVTAPFYRYVDGIIKGDDDSLPSGYVLPYSTEKVKQNNREYVIIREKQNVSGWTRDAYGIESRLLDIVDTTPPPSGGGISYFKSFDAEGNELDTWLPQ